MSFLAFLVPAVAPAPKEKVMPNYRKGWRFWWRADRLDARPVLWSLKNHPEDWVVTRDTRYIVIIAHVPSGHHFRVGDFWRGDWSGLEGTTACSCSHGDLTKFHTFQATRFRWAAKAFVRKHRAAEFEKLYAGVAEQFKNHFIHQ